MLKLTIVTVCLNAARTIERTIKSVINQNYDPIEYIIIDGGSTDGTVDIIQKYSEHIHYWVSEQDNGIYDAMNKAKKVSTGDYICFLNSDDWFEINVIKAVARHINVTGADVVYGDFWVVSKGKKDYRVPFPLEYMHWNMPINSQATFIRNDEEWFFDENYEIAADYKLVYEKYMKGAKFHYIPIAIANFSLGGKSSDDYVQACEVLEITSSGLNDKLDLADTYFPVIVNSFMNGICRSLLNNEEGQRRILEFINCFDKQCRDVVLFGTGEVFNRVIGLIKQSSLQIKYVVDNNEGKWGSVLEGYSIKSPNELKNESNIIICIMTEIYQSDIYEQLSGMKLYDSIEIFSYGELKECFKKDNISFFITIGEKESDAFRELKKRVTCEVSNILG